MAGVRTSEIPHNTPEQVRCYIEDALALVEDVVAPGDLRVAAFTKAVELLSAKQIIVEQVGVGLGGMAIPGKL